MIKKFKINETDLGANVIFAKDDKYGGYIFNTMSIKEFGDIRIVISSIKELEELRNICDYALNVHKKINKHPKEDK